MRGARAGGVVAFVLGRDARARLGDAFGAVRFCERPDDLPAAVAACDSAAAFVELRDRARALTVPVIPRLRAECPLVGVVAYSDLSATTGEDIVAAARAGANGLVLRGFDDRGLALRAAVTTACDDAIARYTMRVLSPLVPPPSRGVLEYCLVNARYAPGIADIARALGVHRKTLVNRLAAAGLPPPQELINWCRLLLAARALEHAGEPVEHVAMALNFPSAPALRNMLRRYTGLRINELRANGGFAHLVGMLRGMIDPGR